MLKEDVSLGNARKKMKLVPQENQYIKDKIIGQGTFGKVYLARSKNNNQTFAIKSVLQDKRYKNRQLSIICKLDNPNIIKMKDYYFTIESGEYYLNIVMDYIPDTLHRVLRDNRKTKKPVDPIPRKLISFQLFKGLYYLQINNVCHRDLKPPNVLLNSQTCQVKICDFGSAKIIQKGQKNVAYICSRYYRAPQLIFGRTDYGTQIDMWSVGCIIVQLLTADAIFPGDSSIEQLIQIIKILGVPTQKYMQKCDEKLYLPDIKCTSWTQILQKYKAEQQLIDLVEKILTYDTQTRITPYQALLHPYFKGLASYNEYIQKLPEIFNFQPLKNGKNDFKIQMLQKIYVRSPQCKQYCKQQKGQSMISTFCGQ